MSLLRDILTFPVLKLTGDSESTALTTGEEGKRFQEKAWGEIREILRDQSEDFNKVL